MKIRTIKPSFWADEEIAALSPMARLTLLGLICNVDDEGRMRSRASFVRGRLFSYDEFTDADVEMFLLELHNAGKIRLYGTDKQRYLVIPTFIDHQYIRRPQASDIPPPCEQYPIITGGPHEPVDMQANVGDSSPLSVQRPHGVRTASVQRPYSGSPEGKGREGKGHEGSAREPRNHDDGLLEGSPANAADWVSRIGAKLATVLKGDTDGVAEQLYLAHRKPHPSERRRYELAKWEAAVDAFVERVRSGRAPEGSPVGYIIGMVPGAGITATVDPAALGADRPDDEQPEAAKAARWEALADEARNAYADGGAA